MFNYIKGHDLKDATSLKNDLLNEKESYKEEIKNIKIGVVKEFLGEGTAEEIRKATWEVVDVLERMGYDYKEVSLPHLDYSVPAYYIIATSEASSNLARYDGVRYGYRSNIRSDWNEVFSKTRAEGFGQEVIRRIMLGTFALTAGYFDQYYLKALQVRNLIQMDFKQAFKKFDILLGPTSPILPFNIGEKSSNPLEMYRLDIDTIPVNLAGIPAISIPCGLSQGLPIGIQLISNFMEDNKLLTIAENLEKELNIKITPEL
jgi:aspartyl-tRNA(Asn)/glutamyl-tRNA(Gln) amidotransferase subunit A